MSTVFSIPKQSMWCANINAFINILFGQKPKKNQPQRNLQKNIKNEKNENRREKLKPQKKII